MRRTLAYFEKRTQRSPIEDLRSVLREEVGDRDNEPITLIGFDGGTRPLTCIGVTGQSLDSARKQLTYRLQPTWVW